MLDVMSIVIFLGVIILDIFYLDMVVGLEKEVEVFYFLRWSGIILGCESLVKEI